MAWISNHKHKIEEKSTKSSQSSSKVVGLGLADLWEFPTLFGLYFKSENLLLINLYRQPDDVVGGRRSTWKEFKQALDQIRSTLSSMPSPTPETVICGDFNLPHAAWPEGRGAGTGASKDEKAMIQDLKYLSDEFFLFQQVQEPTHKRGNVLDLIFCNNPAFVHSYQCSQSIFSDHHIIEVASTYSHQARESSYWQPHASAGPGAKFDELNFMSEDVDWPGLEEDLNNQDWDRTFAGLQPTQMMNKFLEICTTTAQKFVPVRQHTKRPKSHRIPGPRRILMRRRTKVNKQLTGKPSEAKRHRLLDYFYWKETARVLPNWNQLHGTQSCVSYKDEPQILLHLCQEIQQDGH